MINKINGFCVISQLIVFDIAETGVNNAKVGCELNENNGLSVTGILDENSTEADRIFAQYKNRKRLFKSNLIIEGTCNYFFWIDKIALVSKAFSTKVMVTLAVEVSNQGCKK